MMARNDESSAIAAGALDSGSTKLGVTPFGGGIAGVRASSSGVIDCAFAIAAAFKNYQILHR